MEETRIVKLESELQHVSNGQKELKELIEKGQNELRDVLKQLSEIVTTLSNHKTTFEHIDNEFSILRDRTHKFANDLAIISGTIKSMNESVERIVWRLDQLETRQNQIEKQFPDDLQHRIRTLEEEAPLHRFVDSIFFKVVVGLVASTFSLGFLYKLFH